KSSLSMPLKLLFDVGFQEEYTLKEIQNTISEKGHKVLKEFASEAYGLLKYTDNLYNLIEETGFEYSYISRPSIKKNRHNLGYNDWEYLIDLCSESLLSLMGDRRQKDKAKALITLYLEEKNRLFLRIALHCLSEANKFSVAEKYRLVRKYIFKDLNYKECNFLSSVLMKEIFDLLQALFKEESFNINVSNKIIGYIYSLYQQILNEVDPEEIKYRDAYTHRIGQFLHKIKKVNPNYKFTGSIGEMYLTLKEKFKQDLKDDDELNTTFESGVVAPHTGVLIDKKISKEEFEKASFTQHKAWLDEYLANTERHYRLKDINESRELWNKYADTNFTFVLEKLRQFKEESYVLFRSYRSIIDKLNSTEKASVDKNVYKFLEFLNSIDIEQVFRPETDDKRLFEWYEYTISGIARFLEVLPDLETFRDNIEYDIYLSVLEKTVNTISNGDFERREKGNDSISKYLSNDAAKTEKYHILDSAINHPVGFVVDGLIKCIWKDLAGKKADERQIIKYKYYLDKIYNLDSALYTAKLAKTIYARNLFYLYHFFPDWAKQNLIPMMNWDNGKDALYYWDAYMYSARVSSDLVLNLKDLIYKGITERKISSLEDNVQNNFIGIITLAILYGIDEDEEKNIFSKEEILEMAKSLDKRQLRSFVLSFTQQIQSVQGEVNQGRQSAEKYILAKNLLIKTLEELNQNGVDFTSSGATQEIIRFMSAIFTEVDYRNNLQLIKKIVGKVKKSDAFFAYHSINACRDAWKTSTRQMLTLLAKLSPEYAYVGTDLEVLMSFIKEQEPGIEGEEEYKDLSDLLTISTH
ncbi:MAG TPA: hypothetical protein DIV86_03860, partial [Alphaproteobacteria bacterium]|nr:hypothetical protein [Alphaproteobacteria bacterium]